MIGCLKHATTLASCLRQDCELRPTRNVSLSRERQKRAFQYNYMTQPSLLPLKNQMKHTHHKNEESLIPSVSQTSVGLLKHGLPYPTKTTLLTSPLPPSPQHAKHQIVLLVVPCRTFRFVPVCGLCLRTRPPHAAAAPPDAWKNRFSFRRSKRMNNANARSSKRKIRALFQAGASGRCNPRAFLRERCSTYTKSREFNLRHSSCAIQAGDKRYWFTVRTLRRTT